MNNRFPRTFAIRRAVLAGAVALAGGASPTDGPRGTVWSSSRHRLSVGPPVASPGGVGRPDQMPVAASPDCNADGVADAADLALGTSTDCDANGVPDECDPDCDSNLIPDACERLRPFVTAAAADRCEAAATLFPGAGQTLTFTPPGPASIGPAIHRWLHYAPSETGPARLVLDLNRGSAMVAVYRTCEDGMRGGTRHAVAHGYGRQSRGLALTFPVEQGADYWVRCSARRSAELVLRLEGPVGLINDCDGNGVLDTCDVAAGRQGDCNGNGAGDACDIAAGLSLDCNQNGVPDDCDIALATSADVDNDRVPDECAAS